MAKANGSKTIAAGKVTLAVHPAAKELAEWLQVLSSKEAKELKEDIQQHGIQLPILLTGDGKQIIDGRNRWMVAHELKLQAVPVEYYQGKDEDIPKVILSRNVFRRHLTTDQRIAVMVHVLAPPMEKEAADRKSGKAGRFPNGGKGEVKGSVAKKLAQELKVSQHKTEQALRARKAGVLKQAMSGKKTLRQAANARPRKPRTRKGKVVTFEQKVWKAYRRLLRGFEHDEHREVKKHLRNFLAGHEPKEAESDKKPDAKKANGKKANGKK